MGTKSQPLAIGFLMAIVTSVKCAASYPMSVTVYSIDSCR